MTIDEALRTARETLVDSSDTPDLDARLLLEHVLDVGHSALIVHAARPIEPEPYRRFEALLARRAAGEPVAYLVGHVGFWTLDLKVDSSVLVPRPDTETLIEAALARIEKPDATVVDLGTGSGAIALALASERPDWRIIATDASEAALACAQANAKRLDLCNARFAHGLWWRALAGQRVDAALSNPPYVAADDAHLEAPELGHEPRGALVARSHGLADLERIARNAPENLYPGGWLMLEHGADQGEAVRGMLARAGFDGVETIRDLGNRERVTLGHLKFDDKKQSAAR